MKLKDLVFIIPVLIVAVCCGLSGFFNINLFQDYWIVGVFGTAVVFVLLGIACYAAGKHVADVLTSFGHWISRHNKK